MPFRRGASGAVMPEGAASAASQYRDRMAVASLVLADLVSVLAGLILALEWLGHEPVNRPSLAVAVGAPLCCKAIGLYDRDRNVMSKSTLDEVPRLFQAATFFTLAFWLVHHASQPVALSSLEVLILWAGVFLLMVLGRVSARDLVARAFEPERCVVLGNGAAADFVRSRLEHLDGGQGTVIGRIPLTPGDAYNRRAGDGDTPVIGNYESLGLVVAARDVDRVIVAPSRDNHDDALDAIRTVKALGVNVSILPRLFEVLGSSVEFDEIAGATLLGVRRFGLPWSSYVLKRSIDTVICGAVLLLASPFLLAVVVAIKLDTPGPVFFRQRRIGRCGCEFQMLKFRTMVADAEALKDKLRPPGDGTGLFKIADDPRITRVGGFLRATSLDELPQLINVLKGEMSLVGPRPLVPDEDEQVEGWRRRRLQVPPGMTGPWQILGSTRVPLEEMVKMDYLYGANWSLWGDIKTLIRTVPHVLRRKGL